MSSRLSTSASRVDSSCATRRSSRVSTRVPAARSRPTSPSKAAMASASSSSQPAVCKCTSRDGTVAGGSAWPDPGQAADPRGIRLEVDLARDAPDVVQTRTQNPDMIESGPHGVDAGHGERPDGGLVPDHAAVGRGPYRGAPGLGAECDGDHAGGDRRGRAARRATGVCGSGRGGGRWGRSGRPRTRSSPSSRGGWPRPGAEHVRTRRPASIASLRKSGCSSGSAGPPSR